MNKEEHIAKYKESMTINCPIEIKYMNDGKSVSAYAPLINTYFYAKNIDDLEHKAKGIINIWIKLNLENHMNVKKG